MKALLTLLAVLLTVTFAMAEFDGLPVEAKANLGAIAKYPHSGSILLWCREGYTLNSDGSQTYEWHSYRYIPDEAARDAWGDLRIAYTEGLQELQILRARTYTRDGRQIDCTPDNAFISVVPEGFDKAPDYSDVRQMVIVMLGLENGCISELHYRLHTATPLFPWLEGRVCFREENPVIARELTVSVPDGVRLTHKSERGAPQPSVSGNAYTWKMGEQPGYLTEDLGGHRVLLPNVAFTSAGDWDQIRVALLSKLGHASAGNLALPASLEGALVGVRDDESRLDSIKAWVKARVELLHFAHPQFTFTVRPVSQVLTSGYGNGFEVAALVSELSRAVGMKALVVPRFVPVPPVPSLHEWTDPILAVHPAEGRFFYSDALRPRSEFTAFDLEGSWLIWDLVKEDEGEFCGTYTVQSKVGSDVALTISLGEIKDGAAMGRGLLAADGPWGISEVVRADGAEEFLKSFVHVAGLEISDARVRELDARAGGRVTLEFAFSAKLDTVDTSWILPLSVLEFTRYVKKAPLALPTREFAQEIPVRGEISLRVEGPVPDGRIIVHKPASSSQMWDWSEGNVSCEVKDGRFSFERKLKLAREWVAAEGWPGFRTWLIASGPRPGNVVVFDKK